MNKRTRIATIAGLILLLVSVGSVSAVIVGQNPENKANRIVEIAENAATEVGEFIDIVIADPSASEIILTAQFTGNVTLYSEGVENVTNSNTALGIEDYEGAIANATEALSIFREVYKSIRIMLYDSDVKIGPVIDVDALEEAIERSLDKVEELKALISLDAPIYSKLGEAEALLTEAKDDFLPDNTEDAKSSLRDANILISEVCNYLKEVAQELNPQRIQDYCESAYQYRERFRDRFRNGRDDGFDVNGFLQTQGYQNEDDFMTRFREMIENAKGTEDIEDLEEIGELIREMGNNFEEGMDRHRARHGQDGIGSSYGLPGGSSGFGQMGFGSGQ